MKLLREQAGLTLVQAAPGKMLELIDLYKTRAAAYQAAGDETPLWMRHSQGDHWDLLVLFPMGSYSEYYQPERVAKRRKADESAAALMEKFKADIAWQEDLFAYGPAVADLRQDLRQQRMVLLQPAGLAS